MKFAFFCTHFPAAFTLPALTVAKEGKVGLSDRRFPIDRKSCSCRCRRSAGVYFQGDGSKTPKSTEQNAGKRHQTARKLQHEDRRDRSGSLPCVPPEPLISMEKDSTVNPGSLRPPRPPQDFIYKKKGKGRHPPQ